LCELPVLVDGSGRQGFIAIFPIPHLSQGMPYALSRFVVSLRGQGYTAPSFCELFLFGSCLLVCFYPICGGYEKSPGIPCVDSVFCGWSCRLWAKRPALFTATTEQTPAAG
jgi:hypothetical protein